MKRLGSPLRMLLPVRCWRRFWWRGGSRDVPGGAEAVYDARRT